MHKIVLQFGLLVFFLSIIFFSQQELGVLIILARSFVVFAVVTIMISLMILAFIKAVNKTSNDREEKLIENNLLGNNKHEQ